LKTLTQLDEHSRYWVEKALQWADARWDEQSALVRMPVDRKYQGKVAETVAVRDSVWYAAGLFMRQNAGDVERALRIIETILTYQFNEPDTVYHGTFYRYPDEAHPPENPVIWKDYDPNWREFICTVFIIFLLEFDSVLPEDLQTKMREAIRLAAEGSYERNVAAEYTNIALMSAFLLDYAGMAFNFATWRDTALELAQATHALFQRNKTYNEYNSPTYYGIDLYALALWRQYGFSDIYRAMGAAMEADLWRDTAQFYHVSMRNLCGAYDRSYGMDMTDYIAVVGLWIAAAFPREYAPLPDVDQPFEHAADYYFMPLVGLLGVQIPADALPHFTAFQEERFIERQIEPNRTVSAWLSPNLMLGAEADNLNTSRTDQFHPATVHWQMADGSVGWIRIQSEMLFQAEVKPYEMHLSSRASVTYTCAIRVANADISKLTSHQWELPGLTVDIEVDAADFSVSQGGDVLLVQFTAAEPVKLMFQPVTNNEASESNV
jgi:hypothetical protein